MLQKSVGFVCLKNAAFLYAINISKHIEHVGVVSLNNNRNHVLIDSTVNDICLSQAGCLKNNENYWLVRIVNFFNKKKHIK